MNIEKKIKMRMVYCVVLMVLGAASLYIGTFVTVDSGNADYSAGYYTGLGLGVIAASVITLIKNIMLLKNPEKLKSREIYEADERNKMIGSKTWAWAGYAMFTILYVAQLVAGMYSVIVMNTLLVVLSVFALCLFVCGTILRKIM